MRADELMLGHKYKWCGHEVEVVGIFKDHHSRSRNPSRRITVHVDRPCKDCLADFKDEVTLHYFDDEQVET